MKKKVAIVSSNFLKKLLPGSSLKIHATILQILLAFIFESGYIIFAGWF